MIDYVLTSLLVARRNAQESIQLARTSHYSILSEQDNPQTILKYICNYAVFAFYQNDMFIAKYFKIFVCFTFKSLSEQNMQYSFVFSESKLI